MKEIVFLVVLFFSNVIQAITGFAGTVLAMPPSMLLIGVDNARVVLNVMALLSCLWIAVRSRKSIHWGELFKMTAGMLVGMLVGIRVYEAAPLYFLLKAYGVLIIAIALKNLFFKGGRALPRPVLILVLLAAGVVHGMFVSGGALLVVYAAQTLKDKDAFRATVAPVWVVLNTCMAANHAVSGLFTQQALLLIAVSLLPLAVAVWAGNRIQKKINQQTFLRLTYILLAISGLSVLF